MTIRKFGRTALVSALVLTILLSITSGTIAWFTDEVTSTSNIIKSGTLEASMYYFDTETGEWKDASEGTLFDYQLWEPGYTQLRQLQITNVGDLAFKFQLSFASDVLPIAGMTNLADVIDVYYGTDEVPTDLAGVKAGTRAGTLSELMTADSGISFGALLPVDPASPNCELMNMWVALHMQESAGNEYQNLPVGDGFSVKLLATQYTFEEDSFDNQYDANAEYDTGVPSLDAKLAELKENYPSDATVLPDGMAIDETTETITLSDLDSLLYFAYVLDPAEAYTSSADYQAGHGYKSVWYANAAARKLVLDADFDLEGMVLPNGFGNMSDFAIDGQNHTIKNAKINYTGTGSAGLFVGGNRGLKNLTVENVYVTAPNIEKGSAAIVCSDPNANVDNVIVRNSSVKGGRYTGGVVGYNYGSVTNCTVENCSISGRYKTGGIIGFICSSSGEPQYASNNTLTNVNVVVEDLLSGKSAVVGQVVGNWNSVVGECVNNTLINVTGATDKIGKIESNCVDGLVQD